MSKHPTPARTARAFLAFAEREADPVRVVAELEWFAVALRADPALAPLLVGPAVPAANKVEALRALAARAGLTPVVTNLLVALAERDQLSAVPQFADALAVRLLERQNRVTAQVTTAVPLPVDKTQALARRLSEVTGKDVQLSTAVKPEIIGGIVARVGSTVYDGSVTGQLARMRQKLVENV